MCSKMAVSMCHTAAVRQACLGKSMKRSTMWMLHQHFNLQHHRRASAANNSWGCPNDIWLRLNPRIQCRAPWGCPNDIWLRLNPRIQCRTADAVKQAYTSQTSRPVSKRHTRSENTVTNVNNRRSMPCKQHMCALQCLYEISLPVQQLQ
jgi:hypothetical protein